MSLQSEELSGQMVNLPIGNPFEAYRFNRLLRLGAKGEYVAFVDIRAGHVEGQLSKEEVAEAQTWAQREFEKYFSNSPQVEATPYSCVNPFRPVD